MSIEDAISRISTIQARFGVTSLYGFDTGYDAEYTGFPEVGRTIPLAGDDLDAAGEDALAEEIIAGAGDLLSGTAAAGGEVSTLADMARQLAEQGDGSTDAIAAILAQQQAVLGLGDSL